MPKVPGVLILFPIGILIGYLSQQGLIPAITLLGQKYPNLSFAIYQWEGLGQAYQTLRNNFDLLIDIVGVSVVITIITIIETIISGKIAQKKTKVQFNKNREVL